MQDNQRKMSELSEGKMGKRKVKNTVEQIRISRDGGKNALAGYTYQFLCSCFIILSEQNSDTVFNLEGIEDIDKIEYKDSSERVTHVQFKYSTIRQDSSFLKSILKNYLEVYLIDADRIFKLIYDFDVANGNLKKLFDKKLDNASFSYWSGVLEAIQKENPSWNWKAFSLDDFLGKLVFEHRAKSKLSQEIERLLVSIYGINYSNVSLFANGIKVLCLEKMEQRASINKHELDTLVLQISDDISKGVSNHAHGWIRRVEFSTTPTDKSDMSYYEGKKPTPKDIVMGLPIIREDIEKDIRASVRINRVTVIKASSGQGKTTLALRAAYELQDEYQIYQLLWCNDSKELKNICDFFATRVRLGEKPLILIDNLDSQLSEWNRLAQLLQEEINYHYKIIVTTREDDWYSFCGDLSNLKLVKIIKPILNEEEAKNIFLIFKRNQQLHQNITDWKNAWKSVSEKKLLIEYIYLLTHGEMLSLRIAHQIQQINATETGKIMCEILRIICFADICGIKLRTNNLITNLSTSSSKDHGELMKSLEDEFFIRLADDTRYVEGLHPVRSQHVVDILHDFIEMDETALQVVKIVEPIYYPKLFASFPKMRFELSEFYSKLVYLLWDVNDLSTLTSALRGVFSGTVMQYYTDNHIAYNDANEHGGLFIFDIELNPFTRFDELDFSLNTLNDMQELMPDNPNIKYLCDLRNNTPKIDLSATDIHFLCDAVYQKIKQYELFVEISDVISYASITYWLYNIDPTFNLSNKICLHQVLEHSKEYPVESVATIMYTVFCGNKRVFEEFVQCNLSRILNYLKEQTRSLRVYTVEELSEVHVEYVLLPSDTRKGNVESVTRLETICKMLPIFNTYCADAISPKLKLLSYYQLPDDAHKRMPIRNLIIGFHQEFTSLWSKTILSNYESSSVREWLEHWLNVRINIVNWINKAIFYIHKLLQMKNTRGLALEINKLRIDIIAPLIKEQRFPYEDRPFDDKAKLPSN